MPYIDGETYLKNYVSKINQSSYARKFNIKLTLFNKVVGVQYTIEIKQGEKPGRLIYQPTWPLMGTYLDGFLEALMIVI